MKTITAILLCQAILLSTAQEQESDIVLPDEDLYSFLSNGPKEITLTDVVPGVTTASTTQSTRSTTRSPQNVQTTTQSTNQPTVDRACLMNCPRTPEFNPVCGSNYIVYQNLGVLECARRCGLPDLRFLRNGSCPPPPNADW